MQIRLKTCNLVNAIEKLHFLYNWSKSFKLLLLGFCATERRNEPLKGSTLWRICLSNCWMSWWRKWNRNWSENVYLYLQELSRFTLYGLSQNCVNFDHFENKRKNKASFKITQLKLFWLLFTSYTYLLKNKKVIISWNRDFCNFKLKFSANWH